ncbi:hypothetical protein [Burkholderia sp. IMCC1007]|uniref:hypothetical protein n=1 Tax=Burkholderia sp. IMCC1007 TaxID=3004104 RepID=UPI0022B4F52C|nr:hypothetical protein [Burkholderia sp. IMCC1007]
MSTFAVGGRSRDGAWERLSTRAGFYSFGFVLSADVRSILVAGSVGTAAARVALVFARHWMILIGLFAAVGFGLANIVPLFFLHVSRQQRDAG